MKHQIKQWYKESQTQVTQDNGVEVKNIPYLRDYKETPFIKDNQFSNFKIK